jgi:RNA polymerase sigma-70 factor (ECF subfamily)
MWQDDGTVNWRKVIERLTRWVGQRVGDPAGTDDLVQDILERLIRHEEQLVTAGNPLGWMHRIAANAIIDHYRRPQREVALPEMLPAATADTMEASRAALAACIRPLVMDLDPLSREALLATDLGGQSQVEAAREAGIAVSTMKARVRRGRQKLRAAVLRCCHVELDRRHGVIDFSRKQRRGKNAATCCAANPSSSIPCVPCGVSVGPYGQGRRHACHGVDTDV